MRVGGSFAMGFPPIVAELYTSPKSMTTPGPNGFTIEDYISPSILCIYFRSSLRHLNGKKSSKARRDLQFKMIVSEFGAIMINSSDAC